MREILTSTNKVIRSSHRQRNWYRWLNVRSRARNRFIYELSKSGKSHEEIQKMFRLDRKTYLIALERGKEDSDFIALHSAFEILPSVMGPCPCPAPQVKVTISETNPDTFDVSISTNGMIETFKNVTTSNDVPDSIKRAMQSEHT